MSSTSLAFVSQRPGPASGRVHDRVRGPERLAAVRAAGRRTGLPQWQQWVVPVPAAVALIPRQWQLWAMNGSMVMFVHRFQWQPWAMNVALVLGQWHLWAVKWAVIMFIHRFQWQQWAMNVALVLRQGSTDWGQRRHCSGGAAASPAHD